MALSTTVRQEIAQQNEQLIFNNELQFWQNQNINADEDRIGSISSSPFPTWIIVQGRGTAYRMNIISTSLQIEIAFEMEFFREKEDPLDSVPKCDGRLQMRLTSCSTWSMEEFMGNETGEKRWYLGFMERGVLEGKSMKWLTQLIVRVYHGQKSFLPTPSQLQFHLYLDYLPFLILVLFLYQFLLYLLQPYFVVAQIPSHNPTNLGKNYFLKALFLYLDLFSLFSYFFPLTELAL